MIGNIESPEIQGQKQTHFMQPSFLLPRIVKVFGRPVPDSDRLSIQRQIARPLRIEIARNPSSRNTLTGDFVDWVADSLGRMTSMSGNSSDTGSALKMSSSQTDFFSKSNLTVRIDSNREILLAGKTIKTFYKSFFQLPSTIPFGR